MGNFLQYFPSGVRTVCRFIRQRLTLAFYAHIILRIKFRCNTFYLGDQQREKTRVYFNVPHLGGLE